MSKLDELYERACQKIDKEAEQNAAFGAIAAHVKERIRGNIDACSAVLEIGKTIAGAYGAIKEEARKRWEKDRKQEGICITQAEAMPIIDNYYGIVTTTDDKTDETGAKSNVVSLFDMW